MSGTVGIFKTSTSGEADTLLGFAYNFTLDGRYLQFNRANLIFDLTFVSIVCDLPMCVHLLTYLCMYSQ